MFFRDKLISVNGYVGFNNRFFFFEWFILVVLLLFKDGFVFIDIFLVDVWRMLIVFLCGFVFIFSNLFGEKVFNFFLKLFFKERLFKEFFFVFVFVIIKEEFV